MTPTRISMGFFLLRYTGQAGAHDMFVHLIDASPNGTDTREPVVVATMLDQVQPSRFDGFVGELGRAAVEWGPWAFDGHIKVKASH